jgi:hypothetical protein
MADLTAGMIPLVANVPNGGVGLLTGTTVGTLGSNTNGVTVYTAGTSGGRVYHLVASTDDTVAVNVNVYILRGGATVIPLGLVNVPLSSGNTSGVLAFRDFLVSTAIYGLPADSTGKFYIPLMPNDVLRVTTLANLTAAKTCWITASGNDYQT